MPPDDHAPHTTVPRSSADVEQAPGAALLREVLLLSGTVRPGPLMRGVRRPLPGLPVTTDLDLLDVWRRGADDLATGLGVDELPIRLLVDSDDGWDALRGRRGISIERDRAAFRGTGGVLRDATTAYAPTDVLVVASGARVLVQPLAMLVGDLLRTRDDWSTPGVALAGYRDGTPGGLMLVSVGVLGLVREVGFVDFKEQALPRIAGSYDVRVLLRDRPTSLPVRSLGQYIAALRTYHQGESARAQQPDPWAEDWERTFAIAEEGARVEPSATIHDSVVLAGADVRRGAVVVRSVVCPGAVVRAGASVADAVVEGRGA